MPPRKEASYYEYPRPEVLERVPTWARRVLDVGCGAGCLGESLKQRQTCEVWGIERDERAACRAQQRLDKVLCADVETLGEQWADESFDCVVCADVLEHLRDPLSTLRGFSERLTDRGSVVASVPNVRHHSILNAVLNGNWTYEHAGLLDSDHLRFFTRREIEKLFFRAGYEIDQITSVADAAYDQWKDGGMSPDIRVGALAYRARDRRDAEELFTYQFLVEATRAATRQASRTSIVIVTHNLVDYTRACVSSIRHLTDEPYELVFVDNGSTDDTLKYLESLGDATVIRNKTNRGFPAAANQGIQASVGEQILLLNNDTVVTTGWLRRLLTCLRSDSRIGLVGPRSNAVSGAQQIPTTYSDLTLLDGFAWELGRSHDRQCEEADRLVGFCLLVKREVFDKIGRLDEQFGIGNFEDDDFCRRARAAGYRAMIAKDAFVHHVGGATFREAGVDFERLMRENQERYHAKWSNAATENAAGHGGPRLSVPTDGGKLSLCMIVRDNEATIHTAIESIRPWVDEMIVVDTGSQDRTPDICRELGAKVEFFEWCDDFSAARNESLRHATGEWIFWMDSDDEMPAECGEQLRLLAKGSHHPETLGYVIKVHCPHTGGDVTVVDHVKLVRNRPDLRFEHRIHEQILPAIRRAGGQVEFTELYVVHSGYDTTPSGRKRKLERDYRLLHRDLEDHPDHPFVLFNLGMTYDDDGRLAEAVDYLKRSIVASQPGESHLAKAYALLVGALYKSGQLEEAEQTCVRALDGFPNDDELLFRQALLSQRCGDFSRAKTIYTRLLTTPKRNQRFSCVDTGINGRKARHNLAVLCEQEGDYDAAEKSWRHLTDERPNSVSAWRGLSDCLLKQGRPHDLQKLAEGLNHVPGNNGRSLAAMMLARCASRIGQGADVRRLLSEASASILDDVDLKIEFARTCFETGSPGDAEAHLVDLSQLRPRDASVWHNLGAMYLSTGRSDQAAAALSQALTLDTQSQVTRRLLDVALADSANGRDALLKKELDGPAA